MTGLCSGAQASWYDTVLGPMTRLGRLLGSLQIAVPLLIAIAFVLAWGTIYEARFGTAAVQRFVYQAWWFQTLLAFLALNLALAALERWPWKRRHTPFVLAHIGIILILFGGILGGHWGLAGQLVIPEGKSERVLELPEHVLVVSQPNPGVPHMLPTQFEATAWVHEPRTQFQVPLRRGRLDLVVDRYYPDAQAEERVSDDADQEHPGLEVALRHENQEDRVWLFPRDPERFGLRWGQARVLALEPGDDAALARLLSAPDGAGSPRGIVSLQFAGQSQPVELPVPQRADGPVPVPGTPYQLQFKDYFPDFVIAEQGPASRTDEPNNPAVSFTLQGPEGTEPYLLFALHPEIGAMHGWQHRIRVDARYRHPAADALPPNAIALLRTPGGDLMGVLTGPDGTRQRLDRVEQGTSYTHPTLGYEFTVVTMATRARRSVAFRNRSNEVRQEAVHVVADDGRRRAEGWIPLQGSIELAMADEPVHIEYRPAQRELPMTVKLLDFRKIDYPGTSMAQGFESDVELSDPQRGLVLMRTIRMNHPLRYRGFSFYQASYVPGAVDTTVLSVRSDPGTPFVYTGFLIVIAGIVSLFLVPRPNSIP